MSKEPDKIEEEADAETLKFMENCTEIELYFQIDGAGAFMWRMKRDMAHGRIPEEHCASITADIEKVSRSQQNLVKATERFGVPFKTVEKETDFGKSRGACDEYWQWFRHWDEWKQGLTDEDWRKVEEFSRKKEAIPAELLPKKKWNE